MLDQAALESRILALGSEIFAEVQGSSLSLFDPQFYTGKLMNWAMDDEEFKVSLFRFVDVLPYLRDSSEVISHAQEYFKPVAHKIPGILKWGLNIDPASIPAKAAAMVIRQQVRSMAERFILGETPQQSLKVLRRIRKDKQAFTVDLLGEASVSDTEAEVYVQRYIDLLEVLHKEIRGWNEKPLIAGHRGEITPLNISVKLSALYSQAKALNHERSVEILCDRFSEILRKAKQFQAFVYVDMEDTSLTSITLDTFKTVLSTQEFADYDRCGIVLQSYLRRTEEDLTELCTWAAAREVPIAVRLVKGAYWDTESILAKQQGWPVPVWEEKGSSDAAYERLSLTLLKHYKYIMPAFGSHNIRSLCHAVAAAELLGVDRTEFELQALFGMAEPIKQAFVKRGYLVRDYAPIGELIPGMGYLVRRLLENTSNEGFLRQSFREHERVETLLAKPRGGLTDSGEHHLNKNQRETFTNNPLTDFSFEKNRVVLAEAIAKLRGSLLEQPKTIGPVVGGRFLETASAMDSHSPEDPSLCLARVGMANKEQAEAALQELQAFFPTWRDTAAEARAEILFHAAELLDERRAELTALEILEAGKPWAEADADVAEAIDFLNYYAHEALALFKPRRLGDYPGELNHLFYEPRGVAAVICPWNFPLAIPCGMFAAALVTGNTVALKPAEQTPLIASYLFETFLEAGLPRQAAAFLPGWGEEVGAHIVAHPLTSTIAFTGSKAVGLSILREAAAVVPGQEHVKRVIIEMGGKNAIIVDSDADLDEAVKGVVYSAFGFQGQKCSACSRVIVVEPAYEKFVERLREATKSVIVGPATDPASFVGPVIDEESYRRILGIIERSSHECRLLAQGDLPGGPPGYFVPPTVFVDIPSGHTLLTEEIFGPVLGVVRAASFSEALQMALQTEYGLTGAVFSRSPAHIAQAVRDFRVGNLYLNRGCTGALVMRQPFGGSRMSGVGSKAGGPDYLHQFVIPRAVSENTIRRGFAPSS